jgi:hypothetical protein
MVGEELLATGRVAAVNVAEDEPAKTVTLEGTVASEVLFEERETTAPPVGAAAVSVIVPCETVPPSTLPGFKTIDESDT